MTDIIVPQIYAGAPLLAPDSNASATLGLLVSDDRGRIFGITVLAVAGDSGGRLRTTAGTQVGAVVPLQSEDRLGGHPASLLLALVQINHSFRVTPAVPGIANGRRPLDAIDARSSRILLATLRGLSEGRITSIGKSIAMRKRGEDEIVCYSDVIEVEFGGNSAIPRGAAGALVTTGKGHPLGIVIGATKSAVYASPLFDLLAERKLKPLAWPAANRHNEIARQRAAQRRSEGVSSEPARAEASAGRSKVRMPPRSEDILRRYDVEAMLERLEATNDD
jgi:hypothetical protein